jgi:hypothetical protein
VYQQQNVADTLLTRCPATMSLEVKKMKGFRSIYSTAAKAQKAVKQSSKDSALALLATQKVFVYLPFLQTSRADSFHQRCNHEPNDLQPTNTTRRVKKVAYDPLFAE